MSASKRKRSARPPQPHPAQRQPQPRQQTLAQGQYISVEAHQGPLPLPEILAGYDDIVPGAADRIISLAEDQAHHRMTLERAALQAEATRADRGLIAGFIVAISFLLAAVGLAMTGHETVGAILGGVDIVGLSTAFIYGTKSRKEERQTREEILAGIRQPSQRK